MVLQSTVNAGDEGCLIREVSNADCAAAYFILIARANAATGGADLCALACGFFASAVEFTVDRQDQRSVFRDHQRFWRDFYALLTNGRDLFDEVPRIENNTVTNDRKLTATHNARRQHVQFIDFPVDNERMACIVTALKTRDHVSAFRQPVYNLTFSFVAPLSADDNYVGHT